MRWVRSFWFPGLLVIGTFAICLNSVLDQPRGAANVKAIRQAYREGHIWMPPSENEIPYTGEGEKIRYGKDLIAHTAKYFGPRGRVQRLTNGMNCQNCHTEAGTQNFGNPFSAVASTYPRYRDRSGRVESIVFRINDCMQRSMNGVPLDSQSYEMQAMVAYLQWVGKGVPKGVRPLGAGVQPLSFLSRSADPQKGRLVYTNYCARCHGDNGEGVQMTDGVEYQYPPLWGPDSYNTGAGLYRLSQLAGFIKNNMPFGVNWNSPQLTDEQAWDVAAFIASQPRPEKVFAGDWQTNLAKKPVDAPFGPYADTFSEQQHKYGPFGSIPKIK